MKAHSWTLAVRDERGKRHRGVVALADKAPKRPPEPPHAFSIALLTSPSTPSTVPGATALCVPHLARNAARLDRDVAVPGVRAELAALRRGEVSAARHAQYRAGEILLPYGKLDAAKVFLRGNRVDFEHLALLLVEMQRAEALAPYLAIIRHELAMPPSSNALLALETRLFPADASERPPARAPGIARLRRALKRLEAGEAPDLTLDELTADLRFLRAFERTDHLLRRTALDRLLSDIVRPTSPPAAGATPARQPGPARIIKLRPRRDA
jgi:hypothetical protein